MPVALDRSDRKLLLITGFVALAFIIALVSLSPSEDQEEAAPFPSSYLSNPGGALAAYTLLEKMGADVERWDRAPGELPDDCENCVLILADPTNEPTPEEKAALHNFIERGNRVLFTGHNLSTYFDAFANALLPQPYDVSKQTYHANVPGIFSRDAATISLKPQALWPESSFPAIPLYGDLDSPAVVVQPIGRGRLLWWAAATPLTNAGIRDDNNMEFFLDATTAQLPVSDIAPRIFWDEYFHGERNSLWSYVAETPLPWGIVQLAVLGLVVFFTFGRRSGPIVKPPKVSRLAPLEFVDTLGGLYERAKASAAAVTVVYHQFRGALIRQLRLPANVPDSVLAAEAQQRLGLTAAGPSFGQSGLADLLRRASNAGGPSRLRPREALELVRELEEIQVRLGLKSQITEQRG